MRNVRAIQEVPVFTRHLLSLVAILALVLAGSQALSAAAGPGVLTLFVDASAAGGDGSARAPFPSIAAAVAEGKAAWTAHAARAVQIHVAPGQYPLTAPIVIDYPVQLLGSNELLVDGDGRPTGTVAGGTETRVFAASSYGAAPLIRATDTQDVVIKGFTLANAAANSFGVVFVRVQTFQLSHNVLSGAGTMIGFDISASSGTVRGNYASNILCGACIESGSATTPQAVNVVGNRLVSNRQYGILLNGGGPEGTLTATITNNDLSHNKANARLSGGLRLMTVRRSLADTATPTGGELSAVLQGNTIRDNQVGIMIDAGFPTRTFNGVCSPLVYSGTTTLVMRGSNLVSGNLVAPSVITFGRSNAAMFPTDFLPLWQYLHNSSITVEDGDNALAGFWFDNPLTDPYTGSCPADATHEALNNTLIVNGLMLTGRPIQ
jgi:hypothetical protein